MPKPEEKSYYCSKCNRTKNGIDFYASNNLEKYPNEGKLNMCKECLTMHVDNWDPQTFLWILQEVDVPYIPEEWQKLMASWAKDRTKVTGMTIIGRYLSKMKLKQFRDYHWKDTEFLQELADAKKKETMERQGYSAAEITAAIEQNSFEVPKEELREPEYAAVPSEDYFDQFAGGQDPETALDLSEDDITYLRIKWGKTYKPFEWVQLEQLYNEMMDSYDIQSAGHIDTLKLCCKTSLKANQLLDIGDVDGAQKMIKMYDGLMKSGKFTAAQNKGESGDGIDSISAIVSICERDGFIPRYYTEGPQDKVDWVIRDLKDYTRQLVTEEMNLGSLIERAVKQIEKDREREIDDVENADEDDEAFERSLFEDDNSILKDSDFSDFHEFEQEELERMEELFDSFEEDD